MSGSSPPVDGDAPVVHPAGEGGDERLLVRVLYCQATAEGIKTMRDQCQLVAIAPLARYETTCW